MVTSWLSVVPTALRGRGGRQGYAGWLPMESCSLWCRPAGWPARTPLAFSAAACRCLPPPLTGACSAPASQRTPPAARRGCRGRAARPGRPAGRGGAGSTGVRACTLAALGRKRRCFVDWLAGPRSSRNSQTMNSRCSSSVFRSTCLDQCGVQPRLQAVVLLGDARLRRARPQAGRRQQQLGEVDAGELGVGGHHLRRN